MKCTVILLAVIAVTQLNCTNRQAEAERKFAQMEANGIAKVKVDEHGDIYLNGKLSSIDTLGDELASLKKVNGVVWYYRISQNPTAESAGVAVMKKVVEYKLPVRLCASNDPCRKVFE